MTSGDDSFEILREVFEHAILTVHFGTLKTKHIGNQAVEKPKICESTMIDSIC